MSCAAAALGVQSRPQPFIRHDFARETRRGETVMFLGLRPSGITLKPCKPFIARTARHIWRAVPRPPSFRRSRSGKYDRARSYTKIRRASPACRGRLPLGSDKDLNRHQARSTRRSAMSRHLPQTRCSSKECSPNLKGRPMAWRRDPSTPRTAIGARCVALRRSLGEAQVRPPPMRDA